MKRTAVKKHAHAEIIDALGGRAIVHDYLSKVLVQPVRATAVSNWNWRGIPIHVRPAIAAMAKSRGVTLPPGFLGIKGAR